MTASVMRPSTAAWAAARAARARRRGLWRWRFRLGLLGRVRRPLRRHHGRAPRAAAARDARVGPALQPAHLARRGLQRPSEDDQRSHRRRPATPATAAGPRRAPNHDLPDLFGHGQGPRAAGLLHGRTDLSDLLGPRPDHQEPLQAPAAARVGSRRTARSASTSPQGSRPARASAWPAKARPACAAGRRATSTSSSRSPPHPIFEREGTRPLLPRARQHDDGSAGRRHRGADDRWRAQPGEDPGGQPVGQADAPARQGYARAARRRPGRHVHRAGRSRRRST